MKKMILATALVALSATAAAAQTGHYSPQSCSGTSDWDQTPPWGRTSATYTSYTTTSRTHSPYTSADAVQPYQHHNSKWPTMTHYGYTDSDYRASTEQY